MSVLTLDPRTVAVHRDESSSLAPRPSSLRGQRLALVCNGLFNSSLLFEHLAKELEAQEGVTLEVTVVKDSVSIPLTSDQWLEVTDHATVAITGFGGCGSCSTRSFRDALELEAAGIATACVVHEALVPAVQALGRHLGAPEYRFVTVGQPHDTTAHWTEDEAIQIARSTVAAVRDALVQG